MATSANLIIDQGSDFSSTITLKNQNGTPMDLTNFTVKSQFRKSYRSSQATDFVCSVLDATSGKIFLKLPAESSSGLMAGRFLFDIEISSTAGHKFRVLEGIVTITPEITQT